MRLLLPLLVLMLLAGCEVRPNRAVEPPPDQYATGPTQTGKTWEMILKDPAAVNYFCGLAMGEPPQKGGYWMGCYRPDLDAVVLMDPKSWPSRSEYEQLRAHEWGHARGWRHNDDGRGTAATSLPPPGLIGGQAAYTRSRP